MKKRIRKKTAIFKARMARGYLKVSVFGGVEPQIVEFAEKCPACGEDHIEEFVVYKEKNFGCDEYVLCPETREKIYLRWG